LQRYFHDVDRLLDVASFDVLAHLTCPLRYIIGRYKNSVNLEAFKEQIVKILRKLISKNIALEVNASGYSDENGYHFLPDADILKMYYDMGGRLLTLGSDCHRNQRIAVNFDQVIDLLKQIGFKYYCYYEKRRPIKVYI
jgi:histidinol-phosphatase (PHP family)